MKKTLIDLYNGNLAPVNDRSERTDRINDLMELLTRHDNELHNNLNVDCINTLEKYQDCYYELSQIESEDAFISGFSLGIKIMTEAITK